MKGRPELLCSTVQYLTDSLSWYTVSWVSTEHLRLSVVFVLFCFRTSRVRTLTFLYLRGLLNSLKPSSKKKEVRKSTLVPGWLWKWHRTSLGFHLLGWFHIDLRTGCLSLYHLHTIKLHKLNTIKQCSLTFWLSLKPRISILRWHYLYIFIQTPKLWLVTCLWSSYELFILSV